MLQDSAHIQESDAEWKNRKRPAGRPPQVEPLYTVEDAMRVREFMDTCEYGEQSRHVRRCDAVFIDAGHLLGSASIRLTLHGGRRDQNHRLFRRYRQRGPAHHPGPPVLHRGRLCGDGEHLRRPQHTEVWSYTDELAQIIDETLGRGGNVVIPSFAVGRTQELLYFIREIKDKNMVKSVPNFPVYVDSPLASEATTIFCRRPAGLSGRGGASRWCRSGTHMFSFPGLHLTETAEESKLLNMDTHPQGDPVRLRHVRRRPHPAPPEAQPVAAGEQHRASWAIQSPGTLGRTPAGRRSQCEAVR